MNRGDIEFIRHTLLPWSGFRAVYIAWSSSKEHYPDIWVEKGGIPVITVTREWRSHDKHLRRSQLVHEFLHLKGMEHDPTIGYNSHPEIDTYSKRVYKSLIEI